MLRVVDGIVVFDVVSLCDVIMFFYFSLFCLELIDYVFCVFLLWYINFIFFFSDVEVCEGLLFLEECYVVLVGMV